MTYLKPALWIAAMTLFTLWWMPTIDRATHAISLVATEMQKARIAEDTTKPVTRRAVK